MRVYVPTELKSHSLHLVLTGVSYGASQTMIDSNSVHPPYLTFMEKSRCLVSIGSNLIQFGSVVVKISCSEER